MQQVALYVFSGSALFLLYVLFGYPAALWLLARGRRQPLQRTWSPRTVSVVLPVHNGEPWIKGKLESIQQLDYPSNLLQIIVVDDGSTDRTADVVKSIGAGQVELVLAPRGGKAAALNAGIARANGELLLFTDVRQRLDPGSLRSLVECFADTAVGVVSGELVILSGDTRQEADIGLYWRYEKWIRKSLSRLDSVPGATGCLYAMRRSLAVPLPSDTLLDDVYLPLAAFSKGYRVVFDEKARAFDYPTALKSEFRRKVRTQAGMYQIIAAYPRLLLPWSRMWFHFVSHKCARLLLPLALGLIAVSAFALPTRWAIAALTGELLFYGAALVDGAVPDRSRLKRVSSIARTFVVLVGAALCAPVFLLGERMRPRSGWITTEVQPVGGSSTSAGRARPL